MTISGLVRDFLFSLKAEGKAPATVTYYCRLLEHLESYAVWQGWLEDALRIEVGHLRQFLAWVGTRTVESNVAGRSGRPTMK